jgi:hypothetical protein
VAESNLTPPPEPTKDVSSPSPLMPPCKAHTDRLLCSSSAPADQPIACGPSSRSSLATPHRQGPTVHRVFQLFPIFSDHQRMHESSPIQLPLVSILFDLIVLQAQCEATNSSDCLFLPFRGRIIVFPVAVPTSPTPASTRAPTPILP